MWYHVLVQALCFCHAPQSILHSISEHWWVLDRHRGNDPFLLCQTISSKHWSNPTYDQNLIILFWTVFWLGSQTVVLNLILSPIQTLCLSSGPLPFKHRCSSPVQGAILKRSFTIHLRLHFCALFLCCNQMLFSCPGVKEILKPNKKNDNYILIFGSVGKKKEGKGYLFSVNLGSLSVKDIQYTEIIYCFAFEYIKI